MIFLNKIIIECLCDRLSYQSVKEKILNYFHLVCKMFNTSTIYRKVTLIFNENVNLLLDNSGKLNSGGPISHKKNVSLREQSLSLWYTFSYLESKHIIFIKHKNNCNY